MFKRSSTIRAGLLSLTLLGGVGLSGCSEGTCSVEGTVTYDGQPLPSGSVMLYCADGQMVAGLIGPDGRYAIPNVPKGVVRITVRSHPRLPEGFRMKTQRPEKTIDEPTSPSTAPAAHERVVKVPSRYGVPEESGLSLTVDRRLVHHDISLNR